AEVWPKTPDLTRIPAGVDIAPPRSVWRPTNPMAWRIRMAQPKGSARKSTSDRKAGSSPRGGLAQPVQPDDKLAAIVGKEPLTRAEMTKRIWDHIKSNKLQD